MTKRMHGRWLRLLCGALVAIATMAEGEDAMKAAATNVHDFELNDIDGAPVSLSRYRGQVMMIVNVASRCGFTGQYADLQKLYETYRDRGFTVLGFPANNFKSQEPGSDEEIKQFCSMTYGVTFPIFSKISVKGDDQHPLYAFLCDKKAHPGFGGEISWNFNKFLIDREGRVVGRFGSRDKPMAKDVIAAIEKALADGNR